MKPIRIGTRGSRLALFQAHQVADLLEADGLDSEIVIIDTKGDQILDVAIAKIGSKGVFTEALEARLSEGKIDIAVHSAKDLPSRLPDGFGIIAFTRRERPNDVIISHLSDFGDLSNSTFCPILGTSSTRRIATLFHHYPKIKTVDIRGNLQTRIAKMERGICDGLLLAYAGVHRMGYDHLIRKTLSLDEFTPAVGQGCIAVESHEYLSTDTRTKIAKAVNDPTTGHCLVAERSFLRVLEGGCSIPAFALAEVSNQQLAIRGGLISLDGKKKLFHAVTGEINDAELLGKELAYSILSQGGDRILQDIKNKLNL